jgi:hypothetical protein
MIEAMIEEIVLKWLEKNLDVPVYMEELAEKPDSFVLIEKTGSSRENHINHATLAVQSYAMSMYEAAKLNESVKKTLDAIVQLDEVGASVLNSDYNFTDTTTKRYRYQCIYDLAY